MSWPISTTRSATGPGAPSPTTRTTSRTSTGTYCEPWPARARRSRSIPGCHCLPRSSLGGARKAARPSRSPAMPTTRPRSRPASPRRLTWPTQRDSAPATTRAASGTGKPARPDRSRRPCLPCSVETATQTLHRLTSYQPGRDWDEAIDDPRIVQDLEANDMSRLPWFIKRYTERMPVTPLPRELPATTDPAVAVLAGTADVKPAPLDLPNLSRLLYLSAGVVRIMERDYGIHPFRAAGPAGGPLPPGVHWYDPLEHALVQVGPPPSGPAQGGGPAVLVTGVPWRTGWRYRERGYRHIYWDAGTMLAQLLALADSAGLPAGLYTRFPDAEVAALTGADRVHEFPVAVVALGDAPPALGAAGPAARGDVDTAPLEFPLVTAAQQAGESDRLGPAWDRGRPVRVPGVAGPPVESVIAARGSQRRMDASRGLSQDVLRTCMSVAGRASRRAVPGVPGAGAGP